MNDYSTREQTVFNDGPQRALPNATAVLVLGILSIVGCCFYGITGFIMGIIALVLSRKDMRAYNLNPGMYTSGSYSNLKAGRICAIIGVSFSVLYLIMVIMMIGAVGIAGLSDPEAWREWAEQMQR